MCLPCPANSAFDSTTRKCLACEWGTQLNPNSGKCECPDQSFWNGTSCIFCYLPKYFDLTDLQCKDCPAGQHFDRIQRICVDTPPAH